MDCAGSPPGQLHLYLEARAGRPVLSWRWRLGPARFGSYRKPKGVCGVLADQMTHEGRGLCGALPWTTTVSLSLPRCNSPIRKRLDEKLRTDCSLRARIAAASDCRTIAIYEY